METKPTPVKFALIRILTEQFATLDENFVDKEEISLGVNIKFGVDVPLRAITVFVTIRFEVKSQPFLLLEAGCIFGVSPQSWESFIQPDAKIILIPEGFLTHLSVITTGTCRGILHSKTEGTAYNRFLLPTINVTELVKGDISLPLE
ncbi:MAG: hypothetical protein A2W85_10145 [Bacteroidetes bacterium GWF2_41_31]|nr:MAG: hypothetical protein A2W85_10145 [Bacteroidetes bacterium GWF2_41_31]